MAQPDDNRRPPRIPATILAAIGILTSSSFYRRSEQGEAPTQAVAPGPPRSAALRMRRRGGADQLTTVRHLQQRYGDGVWVRLYGRK